MEPTWELNKVLSIMVILARLIMPEDVFSPSAGYLDDGCANNTIL